MPVSVREIQEVVIRHFGLDMLDLLSDRSAVASARPRQIAMFLAKRLTSKSLPQIGIAFNRDHTTVIHAVKRIEQLRTDDEDMDFTVADLARRITAQHQHALNDALIGWVA